MVGVVTVTVVWVVNAVIVDAGDVAVVLVVNVAVVDIDVVGTGCVVVGVWLITPVDSINMKIKFIIVHMLPAEMPPAVTATTLIVKNNLMD